MHRSSSGGAYMNNHLEQENDQRTEQLSDKVSQLKSLTIDIGDEVRRQNNYLEGLDTDFEGSRGLLGSTMRRLGIVNNSGGHRFTCYLVLFALFVFMIIYFLVKH